VVRLLILRSLRYHLASQYFQHNVEGIGVMVFIARIGLIVCLLLTVQFFAGPGGSKQKSRAQQYMVRRGVSDWAADGSERTSFSYWAIDREYAAIRRERKDRHDREYEIADGWLEPHCEFHWAQKSLAEVIRRDSGSCGLMIEAVKSAGEQMRALIPAFDYDEGRAPGSQRLKTIEHKAGKLVHQALECASCKRECVIEPWPWIPVFKRALFAAVARDNRTAVRALLEQDGISVDAALIPGGCALLEVAVLCGQTGLAMELLDRGADPNVGAVVSPLYAAIMTCQKSLVRRLLETETRLFFGMCRCNPHLFTPDVVEQYSSEQSLKWYERSAYFQIEKTLVALIKVIGDWPPGDTELHAAARLGDRELCQTLIKRGANAQMRNERGETPLGLICSLPAVEDTAAVSDVPLASE